MSLFSDKEVALVFNRAGVHNWDDKMVNALSVAAALYQDKLNHALSEQLRKIDDNPSVHVDAIQAAFHQLLADTTSAS